MKNNIEKLKESIEFNQQRINNLEFDLNDSQKSEKNHKDQHLKDVMK